MLLEEPCRFGKEAPGPCSAVRQGAKLGDRVEQVPSDQYPVCRWRMLRTRYLVARTT